MRVARVHKSQPSNSMRSHAAELFSVLLSPYIWMAFAWEDLRDRYKRTLVGVLWIPLSFVAFVAIKVLIFSQLNETEANDFFLYLVIGFWIWTSITAYVTDSCTVFTRAAGYLATTSLPYPIYIYQSITRNSVTYVLNLIVVVIAGVLLRGFTHGLYWLWIIPATIVYWFTAVWLSLLLGTLATRFRDMTYLVQTIMRMLFFLTPILWLPSQLGELGELIALYNPINHYITIIRDPILTGAVPVLSWFIVLCCTVIGFTIGLTAYTKWHKILVHYV